MLFMLSYFFQYDVDKRILLHKNYIILKTRNLTNCYSKFAKGQIIVIIVMRCMSCYYCFILTISYRPT